MRAGGALRSENVGISSKNSVENTEHRKPKVSWATQIDPGLVGPKVRLKSVTDGQLVNIPALPCSGLPRRILKVRAVLGYSRRKKGRAQAIPIRVDRVPRKVG